MCSVAPRAAAPGFGATAFLDRQRGVVAAMAPSATWRHNAGEPTGRRARDSEASTAPAPKRGRLDGFEHVYVDPAASSALRSRMDKELVALQGLLKRAKFLPRSAPPAEKKCAPAPPRSEAPPPAAKRTTSQSKAAYHQTRTAPAANSKQQQQQRAAAKNPIALEVANKQRPAEAPAAAAAAKEQQHPVRRAAAAKAEVPKKRRPEDEKEIARQDGKGGEEAAAMTEEERIARAAAREEFRQMLVDMEKAALPDETIYPEDLEEFGIPFEFAFTRTRKQAWRDYQAKKLELLGV